MDELGFDSGQEPFPEDPADVPAFFAADAKRNPFQLVWALRFKAKREPGYVDVPLENLVTASSLKSWDLDGLASTLEGYGVSSRTRYLAPTLAAVLILELDGEERLITEPTLVKGYMAYVEFNEALGVWRVQRIAPPDPEWEKVRLQDIDPTG